MKEKRAIAVVIHPGIRALDLVGTLEALMSLNLRSPYRTVAVGERTEAMQIDIGAGRRRPGIGRPGMTVVGGGRRALHYAPPAADHHASAVAELWRDNKWRKRWHSQHGGPGTNSRP